MYKRQIGKDVEATEGAEWIMRTLMSIEVLPAISVDLKDPAVVRDYFSRFILRGLA